MIRVPRATVINASRGNIHRAVFTVKDLFLLSCLCFPALVRYLSAKKCNVLVCMLLSNIFLCRCWTSRIGAVSGMRLSIPLIEGIWCLSTMVNGMFMEMSGFL